MRRKKVLFIGGPTATGKSDLAIELAKLFDGEIVNADSVQIYKGMDIGTAKPSKEVRGLMPHHLFDVATLDDPWTVKKYREESMKVVEDVLERGKLPIVVGGSGFYMKGLLEEVPEGIGVDERIRSMLEKLSTDTLAYILQKIDPKRAQEVHPHDKKRLGRAIEIYVLTGKPPSCFKWKGVRKDWDVFKVALDRDRRELKERIYERTERMLSLGWLDEVKELVEQYGWENRVLNETLGYRELIRFLKGELSWEEAVRLIKRNTYKYSKRQRTWFKKEGYAFYMSSEKERLISDVRRWLND
ncbi:tRNA dimethylallyltransferase [Thermosulfidibacter takaii ABI70S6]|uniref:tRNA dimethylallyltransferase n=1 Tax=Thermosulfidibacter takaii (strain DSM 17441 / JCM 13301 / NBRC 103674 / ABI70S6) TaxID=1298851 RepID=A0A0S3QS78_THET7|nr:tRNA (adenosine(37)-N6)-dimethylallyltransferase MiaA [Thermosulfidibacter takaii]BAT71137.1 tRNA dimethylallyltransferase [Thermosulfidibacter takaii ABI70S6]